MTNRTAAEVPQRLRAEQIAGSALAVCRQDGRVDVIMGGVELGRRWRNARPIDSLTTRARR
jgi:hypothetical protein